jgi:hypothetical protein
VRYEEIVELMTNDPIVQQLLRAPIPARLAYVARDGSPRVVPVSYLWNGKAFVFASPPDWPKIKALGTNPQVALTVDTTDFPPVHHAGARGGRHRIRQGLAGRVRRGVPGGSWARTAWQPGKRACERRTATWPW